MMYIAICILVYVYYYLYYYFCILLCVILLVYIIKYLYFWLECKLFEDMLNPFLTKGYLGAEYFCDREEESAKILSAINNGRDLVIYGRRRMGKSALITHVYHKLGKKSLNVWVDLLPTNNMNDLVSYTASAILRSINNDTSIGKKVWDGIKSLRPAMTFDELSGQPTVSFDITKEELRIKTFGELIQVLTNTKKKIVLAFDEFQQIQNYEEKNVEAQLRTMLQTLPNISFIFSGSDQHMLMQMFENKDRPFYSFGQYMRLDRIEPNLYLAFIQSHFKKGKKKISDENIREIIEWCNYRTFNIQMVMNRLYSLDKKNLEIDDIRLVKETILREKDEIYYTIRRLVTPGQWRVIEAFAKEGEIEAPYGKYFMKKYGFTNSSIIRRAVQTCLENNIFYNVYNNEKSYYEIDDIFLRRWIMMI